MSSSSEIGSSLFLVIGIEDRTMDIDGICISTTFFRRRVLGNFNGSVSVVLERLLTLAFRDGSIEKIEIPIDPDSAVLINGLLVGDDSIFDTAEFRQLARDVYVADEAEKKRQIARPTSIGKRNGFGQARPEKSERKTFKPSEQSEVVLRDAASQTPQEAVQNGNGRKNGNGKPKCGNGRDGSGRHSSVNANGDK